MSFSSSSSSSIFSVSNLTMLIVLICTILTTCQAFYISPDYYGDQLPMKKSGQLRALAGSRNCFFSPVNCIITTDIKNSYRKMAKGSNYA